MHSVRKDTDCGNEHYVPLILIVTLNCAEGVRIRFGLVLPDIVLRTQVIFPTERVFRCLSHERFTVPEVNKPGRTLLCSVIVCWF